MKMTCPGPGTRAWGPEAIFESPCPHCGELIEFFKDDKQRPCPACGKSALNPQAPPSDENQGKGEVAFGQNVD